MNKVTFGIELIEEIKKFFLILMLLFFCDFLNSCNDKEEPEKANTEEIITNQTIYKNENEYCAFCDIVYYNGKYYIAFRCANNHVTYTDDDNGYIKIMSSWDGKIWQDEIDIVDNQWDLRDPCFCVDTNDNILSVNYGLTNINNPDPAIKNKRVVFSEYDGKLKIAQTDFIDIAEYSHFWIWKVYFHKNKYWGVAYFQSEFPVLVCSEDGISYSVRSEIQVEGNETALLFDDEELLAVSRHVDHLDGKAYLSISNSPYEKWIIYNTEYTLASPEIIKTDTGRVFVAGRLTSGKNEFGVSIFSYNAEEHILTKYLNLFALGYYSDKGYPGMLYRDGRLYIVYYACNDYTSYPSIYMTTIKLN